jgi:catechol 2,3-dioxygenase-like lactoylglutathione lyase family enzyme
MKKFIVHVALVVGDYDEAIEFYTKKLHPVKASKELRKRVFSDFLPDQKIVITQMNRL